MPNKNNDKSLILEKIIDETLEILNEISKKRTQINFDSEEARRQIAKEIVDKYEQNSERQMKKSEIKAIEESKKEWIWPPWSFRPVMKSQDEHLECALIDEGKSE